MHRHVRGQSREWKRRITQANKEIGAGSLTERSDLTKEGLTGECCFCGRWCKTSGIAFEGPLGRIFIGGPTCSAGMKNMPLYRARNPRPAA